MATQYLTFLSCHFHFLLFSAASIHLMLLLIHPVIFDIEEAALSRKQNIYLYRDLHGYSEHMLPAYYNNSTLMELMVTDFYSAQ